MSGPARHRAGPRGPLAGLAAGLAELAELVLARECGGCAAPGTRWCTSCAQTLAGPLLRREVAAGLTAWSAAAYDGPVRTAVVAWKDRGRADLTPALALGLRRAVLAGLPDLAGADQVGQDDPVLLVPVPSSSLARRSRGHEPVCDLARRAASGARRRGVRVRVLPALSQLRPVADQAGLGAAQRAGNLAGALAVPRSWRPHVQGRVVVVVDDVVTTGATLAEAERALRAAGARPVAAATVAATLRRLPSRHPLGLPPGVELA